MFQTVSQRSTAYKFYHTKHVDHDNYVYIMCLSDKYYTIDQIDKHSFGIACNNVINVHVRESYLTHSQHNYPHDIVMLLHILGTKQFWEFDVGFFLCPNMLMWGLVDDDVITNVCRGISAYT